MARIDDYALLSDTRSAGLVSRRGSIDWLCFPRFDSGACFAQLVGTPENGFWSLGPVDESRTERRYIDGSLVLETVHRCDAGSAIVRDVLVPAGNTHRIIREVEGRSGVVSMRTEIRVRFDYGSIVPWVRHVDGTLHMTAGPDSLALRTQIDLQGRDYSTVGEFSVRPGDRVAFDLSWHQSHTPPPERADPTVAIQQALTWWSTWSSGLTYSGAYADEMRASLTVLKGLSHSDTGSFVAAATTSLPEWIGGARNWDYRYCWLRDATFTLLALLKAGCISEARAWRDWLVRAVAGDPSKVQIMYGVGGERRIPELELGWLQGFENSRPVRIGNGAADQTQLDVYGEVMDALYHARLSGLAPDEDAWHIQEVMLEWLEGNWDKPDEGIWEVRGDPTQFTYSKVMAWVAFDRALKTIAHTELGGDGDRWGALRDRVHADVCANAVDNRGVFTQSYGGSALDASTLMIPLVGFLPAHDPRVLATVDAIQRELTSDGFIHRYSVDASDDGVGGQEGAFLLCSFWLVDCLALMGRREEATNLFQRLLALRNDVGLLAEEYDPVSGQMLGNYPQAFSHVALASSAVTLCPQNIGPSEQRIGRAL